MKYTSRTDIHKLPDPLPTSQVADRAGQERPVRPRACHHCGRQEATSSAALRSAG